MAALEQQLDEQRAIERYLIATLIQDPVAIYTVADVINDSDILDIQCRAGYKALHAMAGSETIDVMSFARYMNANDPGHWDVVSIVELLDEAGTFGVADPVQIARNIHDASCLRKAQRIGGKLVETNNLESVKDLYVELGQAIDITTGKPFSRTWVDSSGVIDSIEAVSRGEKQGGIPLGFHEFDRLTGGVLNGELVIFGAMSSVGKTTFALDVAWPMSAHRPVGFFSVEMSNDPLYYKLFTQLSGIDPVKFRTGDINVDDVARLRMLEERIANRRLIFDFFSMELSELCLRATRLKAEENIQMLFIDYAQLISAPGDSREQRVAAVPMGLKKLAKDLDIPIFLLAQINRQAMHTKTQEPEMWQLRESGALEQTADIVMMAWRDLNGVGPTHMKIAKSRGSMACHRWEAIFYPRPNELQAPVGRHRSRNSFLRVSLHG